MKRFFKKAAAYIGMAAGSALIFGLVFTAAGAEGPVDLWVVQYLAGLGFISMLGVYIGFDEIFYEGL